MEKIWAFEPTFALEYQSKIENATLEEIKAAEDRYGDYIPESILSIENDTATITITGPLSRKGPSSLDRYFGFGGTKYSDIVEAIQQAENDDTIKRINLMMDTPGGDVTGVEEVYNVVSRCTKKTFAYNNGMIASAGYWIAAGCNKIKSMASTNLTGSVGVMITTIDTSEALKQFGIKKIQIVSRNAPDKNPNPSTKTGQSVMQELADSLENIFIENVAKGRKKSVEYVRENFGRGGVMVAQNPDGMDAIKAGMIDGIASKKEISSSSTDDNEDDMYQFSGSQEPLNTLAYAEENTTPEASNEEQGSMEETMDLKAFLESNPDAMAKYKADIADARAEGKTEGVADAQARINAAANYIGNKNYPGIDALAVKVLKGESNVAALEGAVSAFDMMKESAASTEAVAESTTNVPAEQHVVDAISEDGSIKTEANFKAEIARAKGGAE